MFNRCGAGWAVGDLRVESSQRGSAHVRHLPQSRRRRLPSSSATLPVAPVARSSPLKAIPPPFVPNPSPHTSIAAATITVPQIWPPSILLLRCDLLQFLARGASPPSPRPILVLTRPSFRSWRAPSGARRPPPPQLVASPPRRCFPLQKPRVSFASPWTTQCTRSPSPARSASLSHPVLRTKSNA